MSRLVLLSFFGLLGCSTGVEDLRLADASTTTDAGLLDSGPMCPQSCPVELQCSAQQQDCICVVRNCFGADNPARIVRWCKAGVWVEPFDQCWLPPDGGVAPDAESPIDAALFPDAGQLPACSTGTISVSFNVSREPGSVQDREVLEGLVRITSGAPNSNTFHLLFDSGQDRLVFAPGLPFFPAGSRFFARLEDDPFPFNPQATLLLRSLDAAGGPGALALLAWSVSSRPLPSIPEVQLRDEELTCGWSDGCQDVHGVQLIAELPNGRLLRIAPRDIGFGNGLMVTNGEAFNAFGPPRCTDTVGRGRVGFVRPQ